MSSRARIRHVIWDWNGTLLDDVEHAISSLNLLLDQRGMPRIDRARYLEEFGFPVRDFYVGLGFDFGREDFAELSDAFIAHYKSFAHTALPHAEVRATMEALRADGVAQSVLSAMELTMLRAMLHDHGLHDFLSHVRGLDHLQASSKVALGVELMRTLGELGFRADETLLVGDTLHDLETATAMGCHCLLYARGHQTPERLRAGASDARVIHTLADVLRFVRAAD